MSTACTCHRLLDMHAPTCSRTSAMMLSRTGLQLEGACSSSSLPAFAVEIGSARIVCARSMSDTATTGVPSASAASSMHRRIRSLQDPATMSTNQVNLKPLIGGCRVPMSRNAHPLKGQGCTLNLMCMKHSTSRHGAAGWRQGGGERGVRGRQICFLKHTFPQGPGYKVNPACMEDSTCGPAAAEWRQEGVRARCLRASGQHGLTGVSPSARCAAAISAASHPPPASALCEQAILFLVAVSSATLAFSFFC